MATSAFRIYNKAKKYLLVGGLDLDAATVRVGLARGASVSNFTLTNWAASVYKAGVRVSGGGYSAARPVLKTLTGIVVTAVTSGKCMRYDASDKVWTASAGTTPLLSIKYLVIGVSNGASGKALGWVHLTDSAFDLAAGNTLTIAWSASGIFELTGGTT